VLEDHGQQQVPQLDTVAARAFHQALRPAEPSGRPPELAAQCPVAWAHGWLNVARKGECPQKLRLPPVETDHRRVLAVLRYLEAR
jgi:hypothetical protein